MENTASVDMTKKFAKIIAKRTFFLVSLKERKSKIINIIKYIISVMIWTIVKYEIISYLHSILLQQIHLYLSDMKSHKREFCLA
jgi:hypothetical protein